MGCNMSQKEKPIGYWLKEADHAITHRVNRGLEKFHLIRFHWQVLNVLQENETVTQAHILNELQHFLTPEQLKEIVNDFTQKGWIIEVEHTKSAEQALQLTPRGKEAFSEILAEQQKIRMALFTGLTQEEYDTTIKVLKQLVANARK